MEGELRGLDPCDVELEMRDGRIIRKRIDFASAIVIRQLIEIGKHDEAVSILTAMPAATAGSRSSVDPSG